VSLIPSVKIFNANEWDKACALLQHVPIVFTNGCFDILHPGHLLYLQEAASLSANFIVGLNSDESIKKLKGPERPINNFHYRSMMLAALPFIDQVIEFKQETPLQLIERLKPHILVKGGDYSKEQIVGADFVEKFGGRVITIPFVEGYSTTDLIHRIKNS